MCKRAHSQVWSLSVFREAPLPIEWSSLPMYGVSYPRERVSQELMLWEIQAEAAKVLWSSLKKVNTSLLLSSIAQQVLKTNPDLRGGESDSTFWYTWTGKRRNCLGSFSETLSHPAIHHLVFLLLCFALTSMIWVLVLQPSSSSLHSFPPCFMGITYSNRRTLFRSDRIWLLWGLQILSCCTHRADDVN